MRSNTLSGGHKLAFKRMLKSLFPSNQPPIIVSSFGRAGSTLIYHALSEAMAGRRFGRQSKPFLKLSQDTAWDIGMSKLKNGVVYKTHDYPSVRMREKAAKSVFLFGSMRESALSVISMRTKLGDPWVESHIEHLKSDATPATLLDGDALGLMRQCRAWVSYGEAPVLCMRYEALWDNMDQLADFTGLHPKLPVRRPGAPKDFDDDLLAAAKAVYDPLDARLERLPDCFIAGPQFGKLL